MTQKRTRPGTPVHKRFECIDPDRNHNKFYELSAEMLLFGPAITRPWSRLGHTRPRTLSKDYETWEEAKREINAILRKRERRGYTTVEGERLEGRG